MVFIRRFKHIDIDWEIGDFFETDELRNTLMDIWTTSIKEKAELATPKGKTHRLRDSWEITQPKSIVRREVTNQTEIPLERGKANLLQLLHTGRKGFCAKQREDGRKRYLRFFSRNQWWIMDCVKAANPQAMSGEGQYTYNIRKDLTDALYEGDEDAVKRFRRWRPQ